MMTDQEIQRRIDDMINDPAGTGHSQVPTTSAPVTASPDRREDDDYVTRRLQEIIGTPADADAAKLDSAKPKPLPPAPNLTPQQIEQSFNPDNPGGALAADAPTLNLTPAQKATAGAGLSGIWRGVRDVIDPLAEQLARLGGQHDQVAAADAATRKEYEEGAGKTGLGEVGRVVGQTAATAPAMMVANPLIVKGVSLIPRVGPALEAAVEALSQSKLGRTALRTIQGGAIGGETGALTTGKSDQSVGQQTAEGAVSGAILNPVLGAAAGAVRGTVAPWIEQRFARLGSLAREYGIDLPVTMMGNKNVQQFTGSAPAPDRFQVQFNRALQDQMGVNAQTDRFDPMTFSTQRRRIGSAMDKVEQGTDVTVGQPVVDGLTQLAQDHAGLPEERAVNRLIQSVTNVANNGVIPANKFFDLVHTGGTLERASNSANQVVADAAGRVRETLRDALESTLQSQGPAGQAAFDAYQTARRQYGVMKMLEPIVSASPTGDVDPTKLMQAVSKRFSATDIAGANSGPTRAASDNEMIDLARIGQLQKLAEGRGRDYLQWAGHLLAASSMLGGAGHIGLGGGLYLPALEALGAASTSEFGAHLLGRGMNRLYSNPWVIGNALDRSIPNVRGPNALLRTLDAVQSPYTAWPGAVAGGEVARNQ